MATWTLVLAAALAVGVAMAHSYLGERYILIRLFRRDNLPKLFGSDRFTKRTLLRGSSSWRSRSSRGRGDRSAQPVR